MIIALQAIKVVIIFGLILGTVSCIYCSLFVGIYHKKEGEKLEYIGMILFIILVIVIIIVLLLDKFYGI